VVRGIKCLCNQEVHNFRSNNPHDFTETRNLAGWTIPPDNNNPHVFKQNKHALHTREWYLPEICNLMSVMSLLTCFAQCSQPAALAICRTQGCYRSSLSSYAVVRRDLTVPLLAELLALAVTNVSRNLIWPINRWDLRTTLLLAATVCSFDGQMNGNRTA